MVAHATGCFASLRKPCILVAVALAPSKPSGGGRLDQYFCSTSPDIGVRFWPRPRGDLCPHRSLSRSRLAHTIHVETRCLCLGACKYLAGLGRRRSLGPHRGTSLPSASASPVDRSAIPVPQGHG